uniref:Uncharacterized protein n=1 Tax=Alexandrium catenella TaxID=2925 RepID=A0A7S1RJM7_ALECA
MAVCPRGAPCLLAALAALLQHAASTCEVEVKAFAGVSVLQVMTNTSAVLLGCPSTAPPPGESCTLLVAFQQNQTAASMQEFADHCCPEAHKKVLTGVKIAVLSFPPSERDACCSTALRVRRAEGVLSVEFDGTMYANENSQPEGAVDVGVQAEHPHTVVPPRSGASARCSVRQGLLHAALLLSGVLAGSWPSRA